MSHDINILENYSGSQPFPKHQGKDHMLGLKYLGHIPGPWCFTFVLMVQSSSTAAHSSSRTRGPMRQRVKGGYIVDTARAW